MPLPKSRLRLALDTIMADGRPHTVEELNGRITGLVILPGAAARIAERHRRSASHASSRVRQLTSDQQIAVGRRKIIRESLEAMVRTGFLTRTARATYRLSTSCSTDYQDVVANGQDAQ